MGRAISAARRSGREEFEYKAFVYGNSPYAQHEGLRMVVDRMREGREIQGVEQLAAGNLIRTLGPLEPSGGADHEWLAEVDYSDLGNLFDETFGERSWTRPSFEDSALFLLLARARIHDGLHEYEQVKALLREAEKMNLKRYHPKIRDHVHTRLEELGTPPVSSPLSLTESE